jgi:hypothetical protein
MYKFKLFKCDVLVSGRYKRSFECFNNGVVYIIDYKNGLVHGSYKMYNCGLIFKDKKICYCISKNMVDYCVFRKNIMILNYYSGGYYYYVDRFKILTCHMDTFYIFRYVYTKSTKVDLNHRNITYIDDFRRVYDETITL